MISRVPHTPSKPIPHSGDRGVWVTRESTVHCSSLHTIHDAQLADLFVRSMFLTKRQAFSLLKVVATCIVYVSKFTTHGSKKLIICIRHIHGRLDTCAPFSNSHQCTVSHGWTLGGRVRREYLPNKTRVKIQALMQRYALITCSTTPGVH